jgi:hypothetical protein
MAPPTGAMDRPSDLEPEAASLRIAPVRAATNHRPAERSLSAHAAQAALAARRRRARKRWRSALIIGTCGAVVIVAGFGVGRMASGPASEPPAPPTVATVVAQREIIVEPIPVEPRPAERVEPDEIEMTPNDPAVAPAIDPAVAAVTPPADPAPPPADPVPPVAPVKAATKLTKPGTRPKPAISAAAAQRSREAPHRPTARKEPRAARPPVVAVAPPFTREQLSQKFQQIRREYDDYKSKFGSRLEKEWGELATFIQYMPASDDDAGRKEAARRLDAFRGRMRE